MSSRWVLGYVYMSSRWVCIIVCSVECVCDNTGLVLKGSWKRFPPHSAIFCHELHTEPCILPRISPCRALYSATNSAQCPTVCHEMRTELYILPRISPHTALHLPQTTYRALYSATNSTQSRRFCHEHRVNQPYILPRTPHWAICSVLQCVALLQCLVVWCRVYILPSTSRQRALPRTHSPWQNSGLCVETQGSAISFSFCSFFCSSWA